MLRASVYTCVWMLTILSLVDSVNITAKDNCVSPKTNDSCHYHHDHLNRLNSGQLRNTNSHKPSFKYVLQNWRHPLNEASQRDSPTIIPTFDGKSAKHVGDRDPDRSQDPSIQNSCDSAENIFVASNGTLPEPRRVHHRRDPVNYLWKRRTLCSLSDDGQYLYQKTLSNLNGPAFVDNVEDPDSLKTLVRVKRTGSSLNSPYEQEYFKDLADSFPRSSYQYVDEIDNGDLSFDAKREANSQEYHSRDAEADLNELRSRDGELDDEKPSSGEISGAAVVKEELVEKSARSVEPAEDRGHAEAEAEAKAEVEAAPKDPAFSVELARRKRDDRGKAGSKRDSEKESPANGDDFSGDEADRLFEEKKRAHGADKLDEQCPKAPSSLAIADLKADLLRFKRKARSERRAKSYKSKKKKKHAGKKRNESKGNARSSRKIVRPKHAQRPRSVRKGKNSDARADGKSHVGFSKLASKRNNQNNFRRRSVSPARPFGYVSGKDRAALRDASQRASANVAETNGNADKSAISSDEGSNSLMERVGREIRNGNPTAEDNAKLRSKREKTGEAKHGFLSDEEELRYYENIREFEPATECGVRDDGTADNEAELDRAVRSIEEVKDLAKRLVTKVDELENYLSVDEAKRNDENDNDGKRIEIRAIDDLCSNVTATCAGFKEPSEIAPRCVPTSTTKIVADKKLKKKETTYNQARRKKGNFTTKKRSSRESNAKTLSKPSRNSRRDTDKSQKWGRWTDWSSCSVTCGKGRQIRWRYCLHDCTVAETEMEEKACQLPACPPGKFLGIF